MKEDPNYNVLIIKEVEKHPILYNPSVPGYTNRELQDKAWSDIATAVQDSANNCKERWKHLRSSLCRHLRNMQLNEQGMNKKPYYLVDHMEFLIPFTKIRTSIDYEQSNHVIAGRMLTKVSHNYKGYSSADVDFSDADQSSGNVGSLAPEDNTPVITYNESMLLQQMESTDQQHLHPAEHDIKFEYDEHQLPDDEMDQQNTCPIMFTKKDCQDTPASPPSKKPRLQTPNKVTTESSSVSDTSALALRAVIEERQDPDLSFLRSLLPNIKRMTDSQKNYFKIQTLKSIGEILFDK